MRSDNPPELASRLPSLIRAFRLDLSGLTVLTEAATGVFAATPVLAAMAGARVYALARSNRFSPRKECEGQTLALARRARVTEKITLFRRLPLHLLSSVDIVTNSGNLRPIHARLLSKLPKSAVVSLMMEPWEVRPREVDLRAARKLGIAVAGVREGGGRPDIFRHLIPLVESVLLKARIRARDLPTYVHAAPRFRPYLSRAVRKLGARNVRSRSTARLVLLATGPGREVSRTFFRSLPDGATILQLWADLPSGFRPRRFRWLPPTPPARGHMGYLLSDLGSLPAMELTAAGLKVGEILAHSRLRGLSVRASVQRAVRAGFAIPAKGW